MPPVLYYSNDDRDRVPQESQRNRRKAYVAGGWVRDRLMGRCPHDRDYVLCGLDEGTFQKRFPGL